MKRLILTFLGCWLACSFARAEGVVNAESASKTMLFLGDSLAAGYGLDPEESFPALVGEKAAKFGYAVVNAGVSGDTSAGGLRRINWLLRQPVDVFVLELGGNDGLRGIPPEETKKNLQGIIDKVREKYPRAEIVIAGMQMPANMGADYTAKFREVFPELARANQAALIPFLLEGVGGRADLNLPDRIHPTAEGHRIVAENVWKVVEPLLKKAREKESGAAPRAGS